MNSNELEYNELTTPLDKKKTWVKPNVEIICNDYINSGTLNWYPEGQAPFPFSDLQSKFLHS